MQKSLTAQEELVLLAVGALFPDAYAYGIKEELKSAAGTSLSLGTIHTILYRMENDGLLKSNLGGSSNKRGGRSKRLFSLTAKGYRVTQEIQQIRNALWTRISPEQLNFG